MGNLGIGTLRLVGGVTPAEEAERLACGSRDLLAAAKSFGAVSDAIRDCALAIGFVSPERRRDLPVAEFAQAKSRAVETTGRGASVALVFGREDRGLTRDEA